MSFYGVFTCCAQADNFTDFDSKSQRSISKVIDKNLKKDRQKLSMRHNILLLGTGESGKSTFLKQMRIICGKAFTTMEMAAFKDTVYDNVFRGALFLMDARDRLGIAWQHESTVSAAIALEDFYNRMKHVHRDRRAHRQLIWVDEEFLEIVPQLKAVWDDDSIRQTFLRRNEMVTENFSENTRFYLNKIDTIGMSDYVPTNDDIVWTRRPTESIIEEEFQVTKDSLLVFIDVGGQTKERRKWFKLFQDMDSVLFLIGSSQFDEVYDDKFTGQRRNKLRESMVVFEELINHSAFLRVSVILFFNKTDLLIEKIESRQSDIRKDLPDFPDSSDPFCITDVQSYIVKSFVMLIDSPVDETKRLSYTRTMSLTRTGNYRTSYPPASANLSPRRTVYRHFTTAIDKTNIERVFSAMKDTILQNHIRKIMMT